MLWKEGSTVQETGVLSKQTHATRRLIYQIRRIFVTRQLRDDPAGKSRDPALPA
jgi:hypothetical protein